MISKKRMKDIHGGLTKCASQMIQTETRWIKNDCVLSSSQKTSQSSRGDLVRSGGQCEK